jgi:Big-like domain-containing protein
LTHALGRAACLILLAGTLVPWAEARGDDGGAGAGIEWLLEARSGVLELRLVHDERRQADGGVLRVDPNRRIVLWEGIPGERGCRQKLEVPFSSVRAVRDEAQGEIRLEIKGQPRDRWLFVPLPHAAWVARLSSAVQNGIAGGVRDAMVGPDGAPMPVGGFAAFAGPQVRRDVVPSEIAADVRLGVDRIRQALGRTPVPSVELYEALHGRAMDVSIPELLAEPGPLEGHAVRLRGVAEQLPHGRGLVLAEEGAKVRVVPRPEIEAVVQSLVRDWLGQEVEVTGVLKRAAAPADGAPTHEVGFWEYLAPEAGEASADKARTVTIRDLVERPSEFEGQTVRVVGRFRGANLEHDLPPPRPRSAWVVKSARYAIWVTGHGPSGRGFSLRSDLEADTHKWVEVVGRLETKDGLTVLRASTVALSQPMAGVGLRRRLLTSKQPDVVFTLPLAGAEAVTPDVRFLVQFSTYMDEESFEGRVRLRYGDAPAGDLPRFRWTYDDVRRTLVVEPGERLRAGSTLELLLLSGITDAFEVPLGPAPEAADSAARVLRWEVEGEPAGP